MKQSNKYIYYIIDIVTIIIFYFAFIYESAKGSRYNILIVLIIIYLVLAILEKFVVRKTGIISLILLLKITLLIVIELNSKFAINYFLHAIYLLIIIEATILLSTRTSIIINIIAFAISMYKFLNLVTISRSISNIAQMFLFILINSLVIVIMEFAKYHVQEKKKIDCLYMELQDAHNRLKNYSNKIKELTVMEERNRIARDLHDTLGHDLTGLIMQLEMTSSVIDDDIQLSKEFIDNSKTTARDSLIKVRKIVEALKEDSYIDTDKDNMLKLIDEFSYKTGIEVNYTVEGEKIALPPDISITLYRIIQEAMTNAVRHGKANIINVSINYQIDLITFHIIDNGIGCMNITEGYGLKGMKERIEMIGGNITYSGKDGFEIEGKIRIR
ncbi:MAG: sensor histidine kinase [Vallitalea sp.]|nr:sensor histidine kinase [Vallitalea sp.]